MLPARAAATTSKQREGRLVHWRVSQPRHQSPTSSGSSERGASSHPKASGSGAVGPTSKPRGRSAKPTERREASGRRGFRKRRQPEPGGRAGKSGNAAESGGNGQCAALVSERGKRSNHVADDQSADWSKSERASACSAARVAWQPDARTDRIAAPEITHQVDCEDLPESPSRRARGRDQMRSGTALS